MKDKDSELNMWSYWKGKYGLDGALERYYPKLSASDPLISHCLHQLKIATFAIEGRMKELGAE